MKLTAELTGLAKFLEDEIKKELVRQKHVASSKLHDSVEVWVEKKVNEVSLTGYLEDYGKHVDTGRFPGGKKVPIDALEEWIETKGFETDEEKITSMAFAIQTTIFKEGIPTNKARFLAPKRTDFLSDVLQREAIKIDNVINQTVEKVFTTVIDNLYQKYKKELV